MTAVTELKEAYEKYKTDAGFLAEFEDDLKHYVILTFIDKTF
jgi:tryptophan synthase beta chain